MYNWAVESHPNFCADRASPAYLAQQIYQATHRVS